MSTSGSGLISRLRDGLGAQAFSQVLNLTIRLAEVPLFLTFWGADRYGEWLMVATIPSYLAMADGGLTGTTQREMTMRVGAGDRAGALAIFQSTWVLLQFISMAVGAMCLGTVFFVPIHEWLALKSMTADTLSIVIVALVLHVLLSFQCGLIYGVHSCEGRYARGTILTNIGYLLDFAGMAITISYGGGPAQVALGLMAGRCAGLILFTADKANVAPWINYGWDSASRQHIQRILKPSLASMAFPLGEALNVQGMRLLVGLIFGPSAVVAFSSIRTICRSAMKPILIVSRLIEPEIALAYGAGRHDAVRSLFLKGCQISLWGAMVGCLGLWFAADALFLLWLGTRVTFNHSLFGLLLLASLSNSLWSTALMVPYATNQANSIATIYLGVFGLGTLLLAYALVPILGVNAFGWAIFAGELILIYSVVPRAASLCELSIKTWFFSLLGNRHQITTECK